MSVGKKCRDERCVKVRVFLSVMHPEEIMDLSIEKLHRENPLGFAGFAVAETQEGVKNLVQMFRNDLKNQDLRFNYELGDGRIVETLGEVQNYLEEKK